MTSNTPVYDLLSNKENWTQGVYAETVNGTPCDAFSSEACRWCLLGAMIKCYGFVSNPDYNQLLNVLYDAASELYGEAITIVDVNDRKGWEAVCAVAKKAGV